MAISELETRFKLNIDVGQARRNLAGVAADVKALKAGTGSTLDILKQNANSATKAMERLGTAVGSKVTGAFQKLVFDGAKVSDVLSDLALELSKTIMNSALQPLQSALPSGISGLLKSVFGFSSGGVVNQGMVTPFASGGVIATPMAFPMNNGRMGLAGEAGPEAILPLTRGSDGRLGVRAGGRVSPVAITLNISTPDAESFRRSETQVAAMLHRAVSRGQRNL